MLEFENLTIAVGVSFFAVNDDRCHTISRFLSVNNKRFGLMIDITLTSNTSHVDMSAQFDLITLIPSLNSVKCQ